jgi:UDP-4-amino-4,6-dideoxy-N-acetyl-beta-L-altrosamine N-acetyltransferase
MLQGKITHLRALEREDMPLLQKWMNDPELTYWLGPRAPISLEEQNRWFDKLVVDSSKRKLMIEDVEGRSIGLVSLMDINYKDNCAEFGIYLGEKNSMGKGQGKDATLTMLRFAFLELGLNRLYLFVLQENTRAIKSFESCGFTQDAVLRESMFFNGKYHNQVLMSILHNEFKSREYPV